MYNIFLPGPSLKLEFSEIGFSTFELFEWPAMAMASRWSVAATALVIALCWTSGAGSSEGIYSQDVGFVMALEWHNSANHIDVLFSLVG